MLVSVGSSSTRLQSLSYMPPQPAEAIYYPLMLSPLSRLRIGWDVSMVVFLTYVLVMEPFRLGYYSDGKSPAIAVIDTILDTFFLVDLVMNFRTGFYDDKSELVMEPYTCGANYLKSWFLLDFVSSIPPLLQPTISIVSGGNAPGFADYLQVAKLAKFFKARPPRLDASRAPRTAPP